MSLAPAELDYVRNLVLEHSGIALERSKAYLVDTRLTPLATHRGFPTLAAFVRDLRARPVDGDHRLVVDAMTTNETYFFRDVHPFEALRTRVFPELLQSCEREAALRIWCGACSTGQEPFSISMLLKEHFPRTDAWRVSILGTDLNREVLGRAREGAFSQLEVNRGLPAALLVKYFSQENGRWRLREDVRARVEFRELNLTRPFPALPKFDLVLLRNVLIYFEPALRREILARVRAVLRPHGYLFLGCAETPSNLDDAFESVNFGKTFGYRLRA